MRKSRFGIVLAVLAFLNLMLAQTGNTNASIMFTFLLFAVTFVWIIVKIIKSLRARDKRAALIYLSRLPAAVLITMGTIGVITVNQEGSNGKIFDEAVALARSMGIEKYATAAMSTEKISYLFARDRKIILAIGILILLVPVGIWAYRKYIRKDLPAEPQKAAASGNQEKNTSVSSAAQKIQQSIRNSAQQYGPAIHSAVQKVQQGIQSSVSMQPKMKILEDRCCICGRNLDSGYAPLFRLQNGGEARIDESCWNAINTIYNGNDPQIIMQASQYLQNQIPMVDPAVASYLQDYVRVGNQRILQMNHPM